MKLKLKYKTTLIMIVFSCALSAQSFKATQQKNVRVKDAYSAKWEELKSDLIKKGINKDNFEIYIRVFKYNKITEVWLKSKEQKEYKLFKTYDICSSSGELGPKRKQGDGQVPEGFYCVSAFNPYSNYHLSLGVSYPNASDKIIGKNNLGGDIMIHGNCVTIGCIPLTDKYIEEVYILAVEAKNNGQQNIHIDIFPIKFDEKAMKLLTDKASQNVKLLDFWKNLKTGYDYFEQHKQCTAVTVDKSGKYIFK
jgi:murein L,D-transpeptidase YafK